jgi:hypothetical protein
MNVDKYCMPLLSPWFIIPVLFDGKQTEVVLKERIRQKTNDS